MTAILDRPQAKRPPNGGVAARRAVIRWAIRLLRREWRQQLLIFALIAAAVAATFIASAVATTTPASPAGTLGTARLSATFSGPSSKVLADVATMRAHFSQVDVIETQTEAVPGSVQTFELKAQDPRGLFGGPLLGLVSGSYPSGASQVAVTSGLASDLRLSVGGTWTSGGVTRKVTGIVENPQSLLDQFALVVPGQVTRPDAATVLFDAPGLSATQVQKAVPPNTSVTDATSVANHNVVNPESISLAASILGMLLIALVGIGGFSVLAQRRLRSIGMLAAQGATERHIRLVVLANGVATGAAGAGAGFVLGLVGWILYRPTAQNSAHHVIGTFQLPWTVIIISMVLAVLATFFAASRPARQIARVPVVAALAGRPPEPHRAGRLVPPAGIILLVIAFLLLGAAGATAGNGQGGGGGTQMLELAVGIIVLCVALVMLGPACLSGVAWLGRRSPIAMRLALRDLARYRSRSGPAVAAIAIATLIAVIVCVEAAGRFANVFDYAGPNLSSSQMVIYTANGGAPPGQTCFRTVPDGHGGTTQQQEPCGGSGPKPSLADQAKTAQDIARLMGTTQVAALEQTSVGLVHAAPGRSWSGQIYLGTPQLLSLFGISQSQINPNADILTMRPGLASTSLMQLTYDTGKGGPGGGPGGPGQGNSWPCPPGSCIANPPMQEVPQLPSGTSAPNTVVTEHAISSLHLQSTVSTSGWLVQVPGGLTPTDIKYAQQAAAASGMSVETRNSIPSLQTVVNDATAFGIVLALAILAMSVGLVRSEAARDLRTLSATGASRTARSILVATTAGALGFTGALIGIAGGYLAAIGFARSNQLDGLSSLESAIPVANLLLILLWMPLFAALVSWLITLREPSAIARQPLE